MEALRSISPSVADLYATKFQALLGAPPAGEGPEKFLTRMRSHVGARRSFRMVLATLTSHKTRPEQWLAMLKKLYVKVFEWLGH